MSTTETISLSEFRSRFPVFQSRHTGRWGWRRVLGTPNLNACAFETESEAIADRDATIVEGRYDRENGQPR